MLTDLRAARNDSLVVSHADPLKQGQKVFQRFGSEEINL